MKLQDYFARADGKGVLATADGQGRVDAAIYAKPRILADGQVVFIMRDRLTRSNLLDNPHATYLFIEDGPGYKGLRLFLRKLREDQDPELVEEMTRDYISKSEDVAAGPKFLNYFEVEKALTLVGGGEVPVELP